MNAYSPYSIALVSVETMAKLFGMKTTTMEKFIATENQVRNT